MMDKQAAASPRYTDTVVRNFTLAAVLWGIVGMTVGVFIAAQLAWPELGGGIPWPSYGRVRPLHTNGFFFPGFDAATGGLLHEAGLAEEREAFDGASWLASVGVAPQPQAQRISLFCYAQPALASWLAYWQERPTQLLVTPGPAAEQVGALLGAPLRPVELLRRGALQAHGLPWLSQPGYDRLLWSCDLNHVRGEDSLVRALWAGRPFVWQLYPQSEGAHATKLEAFLGAYLQGAGPALAAALRTRFLQWNGLAAPDSAPAPLPAPWQAHARSRSAALEAELQALGDLGLRLQRFVAS